MAAFGYAQMGYAATLTAAYAAYYAPELLLGVSSRAKAQPARDGASPWLNRELWTLSRSFTVQAFWKLVLAEAEKAALVLYGRPDDQARAHTQHTPFWIGGLKYHWLDVVTVLVKGRYEVDRERVDYKVISITTITSPVIPY